MTEPTKTVYFPVIFFDGESQIGIGTVPVTQSTDYKAFQSTINVLISEKIGLFPHQFLLYFISPKKQQTKSGTRKILITDTMNFSSIMYKKDAYFVAELKQSRRERRRQQQQIEASQQQLLLQNLQKRFSISPPSILRRDPTAQFNGFYDPMDYGYHETPQRVQTPQEFAFANLDYENQLRRSLEIQKANYLMSIAANSYPYALRDELVNRDVGNGGGGMMAVCEVCSNANGREVPFHGCVYDMPTNSFRSPAGPIARPSKKNSSYVNKKKIWG